MELALGMTTLHEHVWLWMAATAAVHTRGGSDPSDGVRWIER